MANELRHGSVGTELTQAEWEGVGTHVLNSQASGDIIYAASSSQLSRLAKATDGNLLQLASGLPAWTSSPTIGSTSWGNANHAHAASNSGGTVAGSALSGTSLASGIVSTSITSLGTIATGVWQGTAIAASYVATLNQSTTGNAATATALATGRTINGVSFDGTGNITVPAAAGTLTGSTLASGVTASSLTSLGTIATGVWQGTDVGVAYGGTGASTLTDGGVLLGSGTSAVTAMAVLTDGQMIVGDGSTDPVAESGATLRTSIGVGTGDSPQFTDLTLTDDLILNSDSAVFSMGDGADFTITHDGTTAATIDVGGTGGSITNVGHSVNDWTASGIGIKGYQKLTMTNDYIQGNISGSDPNFYRIMNQEHSIADNTAQNLFSITTVISQSTMFTAYVDYVVMSDYQETIEAGRFLITGGRRWDSGNSVVQIEKVYDDTADARGGSETITVSLAGTLSGASDAAQTWTFAMTADTQHGNPWNCKWHTTVMGGYAAGGSTDMITATVV